MEYKKEEFLKNQIHDIWKAIGRKVISLEEYQKNKKNLKTLSEMLKEKNV